MAFTILRGKIPGDRFGATVADPAVYGGGYYGGDLNGDGFADIIVGAPGSDLGASDGGAAFIYYGGPWGGEFSAWLADGVVVGTESGAEFGRTIWGENDIDADGTPDLLVGAPQGGSGGILYVFLNYKGLGILNTKSSETKYFLPNSTQEEFGSSIAGAFDFDGDGLWDILVGAPTANATGRVYLLYLWLSYYE